MEKIKAYFEDVMKEMRKVSWPSRNEMVANTGITLVATLIIGMLIYGADQLIGVVLQFIYS